MEANDDCIYIYIYIYICLCVSERGSIYLYTYTYTYMYTYIYIFVSAYVCTCWRQCTIRDSLSIYIYIYRERRERGRERKREREGQLKFIDLPRYTYWIWSNEFSFSTVPHAVNTLLSSVLLYFYPLVKKKYQQQIWYLHIFSARKLHNHSWIYECIYIYI